MKALADYLEIGIETNVEDLPEEARAMLPPMPGYRILSVMRADGEYTPLLYRCELIEDAQG